MPETHPSQSPTPRPAVIFDFGGVLMDWNPHYLYNQFFAEDPTAVDRFLEEIGFYPWNLELDRGRPWPQAVAELAGRFPQHAHLIRAFDERWLETLGSPLWPVVELLDGLHQAGYPLYGLSNWSAEKFELVRLKYPFFGWFDEIVISGAVKQVKPEPEIFHHLLRVAGRPAGECVFIDDSPGNIATAGQLGFQTILFRSAEQLRVALEERGIP